MALEKKESVSQISEPQDTARVLASRDALTEAHDKKYSNAP